MITQRKELKLNCLNSVNAINVSEITIEFDGDLEINRKCHNYFINKETYKDALLNIDDNELKSKIKDFFEQLP